MNGGASPSTSSLCTPDNYPLTGPASELADRRTRHRRTHTARARETESEQHKMCEKWKNENGSEQIKMREKWKNENGIKMRTQDARHEQQE